MEEDEEANSYGEEEEEEREEKEEEEDEREAEESRRKYSIIFEALNDIVRQREESQALQFFQHLEIKSDVGEMSLSDTATDPTNQLAALSEGCLNR